MFCLKGVLKIFVKFTEGLQLYSKETPTNISLWILWNYSEYMFLLNISNICICWLLISNWSKRQNYIRGTVPSKHYDKAPKLHQRHCSFKTLTKRQNYISDTVLSKHYDKAPKLHQRHCSLKTLWQSGKTTSETLFPQNTMTKRQNYITDTIPSKHYDKVRKLHQRHCSLKILWQTITFLSKI